jgi:hypothetical protein
MKDLAAQMFGGALAFTNSWKALIKVATAITAIKFMGFKAQNGLPVTNRFMTHLPDERSFFTKILSLAVNTANNQAILNL